MSILKVELTDEQKEILKECKTSLDKYNQAAVLLSMGGGKSYIAANVFKYLKKNNKKFKALWITTINDMNKAKNIMKENYFSESITYTSFSKMQKGEEYANELYNEHKKFDLVVIDEAHHALATQTYKGISSTLEKFNDAKLLVLTATKRRYSDRKHIFEWLTPKLTLGVDYKDRGLKYAVDNNLTCDFVYQSCNIQALRDYRNALNMLKEYSNIYSSFDSLIDKSSKIINDYTDNIFNKLGKVIRRDLQFDGSEGDRWFVFYHWIDEIEENKDKIKEMFKLAYDNENVNINIIEYHSGISDKGVVDNIVGEPIPNQVDIILTCNKGGESLHPKNTRGIIMLRRTLSNTVFEQQLGRALEIRDKCNYVKYIYDCVDNRNNILKSESIYNGLEKPDERRIASTFKSINNAEDIIKALQKKYGDNFDVEIFDEDIEEILKDFNNIQEIFESLEVAKNIDEVLKLRAPGGEEYKNLIRYGTFSPKLVLSKFDEEYKTKLADAFYNIQRKFICGFFGEHFADEEKEDDIYNRLYDLFGDVLYLLPSSTVSEYKFTDLIKIAYEVKRFNFDYKNSISRTKELKHQIAELRQLNLKGKLSESYQVFCKRNKIDINGIYSNLIKEVVESSDSNKYPDIIARFKRIDKDLAKIDTELKVLDYSKDKAIENGLESRLLDILAKEQILTVMYSNIELGVQASTAINLTYRNAIKVAKKVMGSKENYLHACSIIKSIRKIEIHSGGVDDTQESILRQISIDMEYPIINLVKRNEEDNVSIYELYVLENLGINVINNERRNANIRKLIDRTPFGIIYKRFIENAEISDFNKLKNYKIDGLPEYAQKMLRTKAYKASKEQVDQELLMKKESVNVKDAVKGLVYFDGNNIDIIKKAIEDKEIDSRKVIRYAIPEKIYLKNKNNFDKAFITPWSMLELNVTSNIIKSLSDTQSCYDCIIENLLEADIIPNMQIEMANVFIGIAKR